MSLTTHVQLHSGFSRAELEAFEQCTKGHRLVMGERGTRCVKKGLMGRGAALSSVCGYFAQGERVQALHQLKEQYDAFVLLLHRMKTKVVRQREEVFEECGCLSPEMRAADKLVRYLKMDPAELLPQDMLSKLCKEVADSKVLKEELKECFVKSPFGVLRAYLNCCRIINAMHKRIDCPQSDRIVEAVSVRHDFSIENRNFVVYSNPSTQCKDVIKQIDAEASLHRSGWEPLPDTQRVTEALLGQSRIAIRLGNREYEVCFPRDASLVHTPRQSALAKYGKDLTALAAEGALDPLIGRQTELDAMMRVLCRRTKGNPVLIGEAGVGKTAIVQGLAQKIVAGAVPDVLAHKRIIALNLNRLVAGSRWRGSFEERIQEVLDEVRACGDVILYIDEMHMVMGAGASAEQPQGDVANILKPALDRGEILCIGATTEKEYKKYIEMDEALERRFQRIAVHPPSVEQTIQILKGLQRTYEGHHGCRYTEGAIHAIASLSDRFCTDRHLPDKAIDLFDDAGAEASIRKRPTIDASEIVKLFALQSGLPEERLQACLEGN